MRKRSHLHFGIKTKQYFPYEDILRVWQEADTLPSIEHAWLFDHPMPIGSMDSRGPCLDGWTLLAALAAQSKRLRLGLLVASNVNQTPPWLAKRAATVDIISHGRLEFGLGAGGTQREHEAYGTDFFPAAQRIGRLSETCEVIRHMWTEPTVDFEGRYYCFTQACCEPKPMQKPHPPFVIGGWGEQQALRVVARYADIWNGPGPAEEFQRKSHVIDNYCAEIGRDLATIARSAEIAFDPQENPATIRQRVGNYIAVGATHLVLAPRTLEDGIAHWVCEQIIEPIRSTVGDAAPG